MVLTGVLIFIILTVTGAIIKYGNQHWLIAGYNTLPEEKKKNVDIAGLANFLGNWLFGLGTFTLVGSLITAHRYPNLFPYVLCLCTAGTILMIPKAQKFDHNQKSRRERAILIAALAFAGLVLIAAAGMMIYGHRSAPVELKAEGIVIGGIYSTTIPREEIVGIELIGKLPRVLSKSNGFSSGEVRKGHFILEELGRGRLYLESYRGPFICIFTTNGYTMINFSDSSRTETLFQTLVNAGLPILPRAPS